MRAAAGPRTSLVRGLTLLGTVALVVGNMVGTSIYTLPASLAEATGPLGLVAWGLTAFGYLFVALVYASLGVRYPRTGGPYVFAREAFGEFAGFQTVWSYWISAVIGNAAITTGVVAYAISFSPTLSRSVPLQFALAQGLLWGLCLLNVIGVRQSARLQITIMFANLVPLLTLSLLALRRFDAWGIHYIIGFAKNEGLINTVAVAQLALAERHEREGGKQRWIGEFSYAARSWDRQRRVIARLEHDARGANPRFVVTSLEGDAQALYEQLYCARGEAENRIKEAQIDLFGRRASCHKYAANQLRLLLAALAYTLMVNLRRLALKGTELERACAETIRLKLLKIGAAVIRNTRRVRLLLASSHPMKNVFLIAARALAP